jgi:hypothetical protein
VVATAPAAPRRRAAQRRWVLRAQPPDQHSLPRPDRPSERCRASPIPSRSAGSRAAHAGERLQSSSAAEPRRQPRSRSIRPEISGAGRPGSRRRRPARRAGTPIRGSPPVAGARRAFARDARSARTAPVPGPVPKSPAASPRRAKDRRAARRAEEVPPPPPPRSRSRSKTSGIRSRIAGSPGCACWRGRRARRKKAMDRFEIVWRSNCRVSFRARLEGPRHALGRDRAGSVQRH